MGICTQEKFFSPTNSAQTSSSYQSSIPYGRNLVPGLKNFQLFPTFTAMQDGWTNDSFVISGLKNSSLRLPENAIRVSYPSDVAIAPNNISTKPADALLCLRTSPI